MSRTLRALAERDHPAAAPYDFAEFQRRAAARPAALRTAERVLRLAAVIAPLALLLTIAGMVRRDVVTEPDTHSAAAAAAVAIAIADGDAAEPALVRVGPTARVIDLEDRIAWLDTMISAAPVSGLSTAERAQLSSGREALANSLERVRYAQTLLAD